MWFRPHQYLRFQDFRQTESLCVGLQVKSLAHIGAQTPRALMCPLKYEQFLQSCRPVWFEFGLFGFSFFPLAHYYCKYQLSALLSQNLFFSIPSISFCQLCLTARSLQATPPSCQDWANWLCYLNYSDKHCHVNWGLFLLSFRWHQRTVYHPAVALEALSDILFPLQWGMLDHGQIKSHPKSQQKPLAESARGKI